ncbi:MAG: hypothetical protein KKA05_04460 [Alphaproteobacteria bacterium]|nr:hypothetical protein [Alphaproteobacteria bacterium]MBU0858959.1 hypothetical protein [Alphaproteobacteria bacterium]
MSSLLPRVLLTSDLNKIDVPVPQRLIEYGQDAEWAGYIKVLPLDSALKKFAESVDRYHAHLDTHPAGTDFAALPPAAQEETFSLWAVANASGHGVRERLSYPVRETDLYNQGIDSDLATALFFTADTAKRLQMPDAPQWQARFDKQLALTAVDNSATFNNLVGQMLRRMLNAAKTAHNTPRPQP